MDVKNAVLVSSITVKEDGDGFLLVMDGYTPQAYSSIHEVAARIEERLKIYFGE